MSDDKNLDENLISGHEYDGIKELDNPLPNWWLVTFYGTIIFSVIYFIYYEIGSGPSHDEQLATAMNQIESARQKEEAAQLPIDSVDFAALAGDEVAMGRAEEHFLSKCAACHKADGGGMIGPNLTDNHFIYGKGRPEAIVELIRNGLGDKGMPPWKGIIADSEILELAAYVKAMAGTNVAGGKAAQGDLVE